MSLRDKLEIRDTGFRMPEEPHQPLVELEQIETTGTLSEWEHAPSRMVFRTTLRVSTQWSANTAEYRRAQDTAARAIAETLYGNVQGRLRRARQAIYSRDWKTALQYLDEMEKEMEW